MKNFMSGQAVVGDVFRGAVASSIFLVAALTGCEADPGYSSLPCETNLNCPTGFICNTSVGYCVPDPSLADTGATTDTFEPDTGTGGDVADTADTTDTVEPLEYRYVAVVSRATGEIALNNQNPGSDIDAISVSSGTAESFPSVVEAFASGPEGDEGNARPLSTHADAVLQKDTVVDGVCDLDAEPGYVALGGDGGVVVVSFDTAFEDGDIVTVYEIDSNYCTDAATDRPDRYDVYATHELDGALTLQAITETWCFLGASGTNGGVAELTFDSGNCE
jgi:hypothetical protein